MSHQPRPPHVPATVRSETQAECAHPDEHLTLHHDTFVCQDCGKTWLPAERDDTKGAAR